ncbi:hypothetical protein [Nonomuraea dietziae]|uniref:hypothetical protein n=1 Tax=Nonomuraea dietziae TaxID=65515 RepID=UPI0033D5969B
MAEASAVVTARELDGLEPEFVSDVRDDDHWHSVTPAQGDALRAWMRANSIEPNDVYRIETYTMDCAFARVFAYARTEHGQFVLDCPPDDSEHRPHRGRCSPVKREPYITMLASRPPELAP